MPSINEYKVLVKQFLDGEISTTQFENRYSAMFKAESGELEEKFFLILDRLQCDIHVYEPNPELYKELSEERPGFYLNEIELREEARVALRKLSDLEKENS
ncbi:MAG: hypothetical protein KF722_06360 [Nitrospira sp.]|nr:hypothetical protein [Nitrospira sp.]